MSCIPRAKSASMGGDEESKLRAFTASLSRGISLNYWDDEGETDVVLKLKNNKVIVRSSSGGFLNSKDRCIVALTSITYVELGTSANHIFPHIPTSLESPICFHIAVRGIGTLDFATHDEFECEAIASGLQMLVKSRNGISAMTVSTDKLSPQKRMSLASSITSPTVQSDSVAEEAHFVRYMVSSEEEEKEVTSPSIEDREKARQSFAGVLQRTRSARGATFTPVAVPEDDVVIRRTNIPSLPRKRSQRDGFDI